jgi:hypothetical protein
LFVVIGRLCLVIGSCVWVHLLRFIHIINPPLHGIGAARHRQNKTTICLRKKKNNPDPEVWAWASQTRPISKHILLWTSATKVLPKPSTKHTNIQHTFTYFDPNLLIYALISTQYCF